MTNEEHITVTFFTAPASDTKPFAADYEQYDEYSDACFMAAEAEYHGAPMMRIWALLSNGRRFTIDGITAITEA